MHINRRQLLGLAGLAGASAMLAGCMPTGAPEPTTKASAFHAADPKTAKGTVSYWNHFTGEDERRGFQAVTDGFSKAFPGLTLKEESIPNADFMTKFTTATQAGSLPDAVMVHANRVREMAAMGGLVDIAATVDSWEESSDLTKKLLAPFRQGDALYAIPSAVFVDWYYYRPDWLEKLGFSQPPATWEEFREVSKAMTGGGRYGLALRGGPGGGEGVIKMIRGYNGALIDADGKPQLELDAVRTALDEFSALYLKDKSVPPSAPADGYNQIFQTFLNGETGLLIHHTGSLKSVTSALRPGEQVMAAPLPKAVEQLGWVQPLGNGITNAKTAENALAWIEYWGSAKPQVDFFDATGYVPATTSGQEDKTIAANPLMGAANKQVEIGVTPEYFNGMTAWQENSVLVQFQSLLVGKTTLDEAAKQIHQDFLASF